MMEIGPKTALQHLIDRIKRVQLFDEVAVATTVHPRDSVIVELCQKLRVPVHRGSEEDVLGRYVEAAEWFHAGTVFRATSDEPFKDPEVIQQVLETHLKSGSDYTCNNLIQTFPDGCTVEIVNVDALEKADRLGKQSADREHVTFYIRQRPTEFKICNVEAQGKLRRPELRYCLDTEQDLRVVRTIFDHLGGKEPYFTIAEVINFLDEHQNKIIQNLEEEDHGRREIFKRDQNVF